MHTFIIVKPFDLSLGWTAYTLWSTIPVDELFCSYEDGTGTAEHFSEYRKWAQVIYRNPGAGRVIMAVEDESLEMHQTEITSDADWAIALLTHPVA